ncbi:MAG: hypothetical protein ACM37W_13970 [Actinomycetota bacterium]
MPLEPNRPKAIVFSVNTSHPELLAGLDLWLKLGLLSDTQVKELCQDYLTCPIPQPAFAPTPTATPIPALSTPTPRKEQVISQEIKPPAPPSFLASVLHSLMAELSVVWLLFLGVFLVVVSSGVLAASQWQRFPAAGQYGVLLAYTLTFWGISGWVNQQRNLHLTAQTLRMATLLLVPINFWAMDTFGLWRNPGNWVVVATAAVSLTLITWNLLKQESAKQLPALNHLWLSYLHWGWGLPGFALIAVYLGTLGTAISTIYQTRQQVRLRQRKAATENSPDLVGLKSRRLPVQKVALVVYALAILLGRAIFVKKVEIDQLGLVLGICGALLAWLHQQLQGEFSVRVANQQLRPENLLNWEAVGGGLLALGWLVSVAEIPGQAIAVSGLALWFFSSRLLRFWRAIDLALLFGIGLQAIWLGWRLIPPTLQGQAIALLTQLTSSQQTPWALLGLVLFPYLILMLVITQWLDRSQQPRLARFGEALALIFGVSLTVLSSINPLLRTLNLLASTLTLGWVTRRSFSDSTRSVTAPPQLDRPATADVLVYFTHALGILTLSSGIHYFLPHLSPEIWATICLGMMVTEWGFFVTARMLASSSPDSPFALPVSCLESAWYLGLVLASLSFLLLANHCLPWSATLQRNPGWCLIWLVTPLSLTAVAQFTQARQRQLASGFSTTALFCAQFLTWNKPDPQLISLGIATGLMFLNTRYLPQPLMARITVGFGLSFLGMSLGQGLLGFPKELLPAWLMAGAVATFSLWLLRGGLLHYFSQEPRQLGQRGAIYTQALDEWALILCGAEMLLLVSASLRTDATAQPMLVLAAAATVMLATAYRSWQFPRTATAIWGSVAAIVVAQLPLLPRVETRLLGLGLATVLLFGHSWFLPQVSLAAITVGFGLSLAAAAIAPTHLLAGWDWGVAAAVTIFGLWLIRHWLIHNPTPHRQLRRTYAQATDGWAMAIAGMLLVMLTLHAGEVYGTWLDLTVSPSLSALVATLVTMAAIVYRTFRQPSAWGIYSFAWGLELLTAEILGFVGGQAVQLAVANVALGLLTQLLGDWWQRRHPNHELLPSVQIIPLLYGGLGAVLRSRAFTSWTGLISLGVALIAIGIGRRNTELKPLVYLGLLGVSLSAYELLLYQLWQTPGEAVGDWLIAMAALGGSLMYAVRLLLPWLIRYLHLTRQELQTVAHLHWGWSSLLLVAATLYPLEAGLFLGLGTGACLVQYAIFQGRRHPQPWWGEVWVYIGFIEAIAIRLYWLNTPVAKFIAGPLVLWKIAIAAVFAYGIDILPWEQWGWRKQPWKVAAFLIPLIAIAESRGIFHPLSLLIAAGFYLFLAWENQQIRFTYLSVLLVDWVLWRWFSQMGFLQSEWYAVPLGFSLLYVAQVDAVFKTSEYKEPRHLLRILGIGLICVIPLLTQTGHGLEAAILSLGALLAGLALRVRAFLYVGTAIFLIDVFYQLVILIFDYPLIKSVIGLIGGVILIWIAATFETQRDRLTVLLQQWLAELAEWE